MIIECPRCKTRYSIKDSEIPNGGGPVECIECGNIFTIFIEPLSLIMNKVTREESESEFQRLSHRQPSKPETYQREGDFFGKKTAQPKKTNTIFDDTEMFRSELESNVKQTKNEFSSFGDDFNINKPVTKPERTTPLKSNDSFDFEGFTSKPKISFDDSLSMQSSPSLDRPKTEQRFQEDFAIKKSKDFAQPSSSLEEFFNIPKTPEDKLKNLANRVVNELKMYYPQESDEAATTGKIPVNLLNEIKKALQFYRQEAIKDTSWETAVVYFRDAINTIIGKNKILFR
ncbi:zinc-ribbon domain-containing protein [candidate division WOR-3 bacterium]|nr:zinc-ribbon domain-containing protein [candidate division WOR-3 bacterium]